MAYGFLCAKCGYQETNHRIGLEEGEDTNKRLRGYRYSLNKCPGFSYSKRDRNDVADMFSADPVKSFPDELRRLAEKRERREWIRRGFPSGFPPINHSVFAILSNGQIVDIGS